MNNNRRIAVLMIGAGYFPHVTAGEKNFFFELLPRLSPDLRDLCVLSVNDQDMSSCVQRNAGRDIIIYNASRSLHWFGKDKFHGVTPGGLRYYHHRHRPPQEVAERTLTLLALVPRIRRIVRKHKIDVIHYMENFGPAMWATAFLAGRVKTSYSAANYQPRGIMYDRYLRWSFRHVHGIAAYTDAYADILADRIGLSRQRIARVPWGVDTGARVPLSPRRREEVRRQYGLRPERKVVLWTGYIQQIQEQDFYLTMRSVKAAVPDLPEVDFVFAFKPEAYNPRYQAEACERVQVITNVSNFKDLLESADFLLSPVHNQRSTVAPPLTWLEAMLRGTLVITTDVPGARESIQPDITGFIVPSYDELAEQLKTILSTPAAVRADMEMQAANLICRRHGLEQVAANYLAFWENLVNHEA